MNYKKGLIFLTAVLAIGILFTTAYNMDKKKLATDSGFDSDYGGGSDYGGSWDSSDGSGGSKEASPQTVIAFLSTIFIVTTGYGIRRIFRKKEKDDSMLIDCIYGGIFIFPFALLSGFIIVGLELSLLNSVFTLLGITMFYYLINTIRNKSLGKVIKIEYIIIILALIIALVSGFFITKDFGYIIILIIMIPVLLPFLLISLLIKTITGKGIMELFSSSRSDFNNNIISSEEKNKLLMENNLDEEKICKDAYEIYKRIQLAWMNDSLTDVDDCISDEIKSMYSAQLLTLRQKNQQNVMSDFEYVSAEIVNVKNVGINLSISIELRVKCKDYIINKENGKVLRGNKNKTNNYYYELVFLMNREAPKHCPNCGHELKKGGGIECPSCKSKLVLNNGNMMMTKKRMISQN